MSHPTPTERIALCSWSLQPANPQDLVAKLKATGINRVQLALDPLRDDPGVWGQTPALFRDNGFTIVSGMLGCVGEDYSTLESIRLTGGVAPDSTWEQNWKNVQATAALAQTLGLKLVTFHAGFLPHEESDPAFAKLPVEQLLSKDYAKQRAALIDLKHASLADAPGEVAALNRKETTYLCTADGSGMMVSLIQSNYTGFGSGYAVAEWGFGIHDRGAQFDLRPGRPNSLEPGKRPFHTIIPAFVTRDGKPWIAFGVMGGDMQPQGHAQVLVNLLDLGMNLQEAGDAPRFYHTDSSEPTGTTMKDGGQLALEPGVPDQVRRDLARRGHRIVEASPLAFGGYQAVMRDPATGVLAGASESRKDGCAMGY